MLLYIKGKEKRKLLVDLVLNGPFDYRIITEAGTATTPAIVRKRRYDELTDAETLREACDIKSTNIVLQVLPQDIYNLERESKLYDEFDMFTSVLRETIHSYYLSGSKFVTDVKLAKELNNTNFDQLYTYLRQHEAHADEMRIMKERFLNPLALVANTYNSSPSYSIQTQYEQQISPFASQKQVSSLSSQQLYDVPMIQHRLVVLSFLPSDDPIVSLNKCTKPKRPRNSAWFKEKAMLAEALESGRVLDDELMAFLADNGDTVTTVPTHENYPDNHVIDQNVQEMQYFEQPDFNYNPNINIISDSNMISYEQYLKETKNTVLQDTSSSAQNDAMIMYVIEEMSNQVAKYSRLKMHAKQNDLIVQEKKINIAPIDYVALNKLSEHFVKHFVPQKQLFVEQAFWLPILKLIFEIPPVQPGPVLKEIPHELPTFSLVKDTFNKISHVNDFENVVTVRTRRLGTESGFHKEITDMKEVFTQMETKVAKCSVERKTFEIKEKELLLENERLLELLISRSCAYCCEFFS
ncbi:hypothetical protein Tco_0014889 [Tanacetum coccineum]